MTLDELEIKRLKRKCFYTRKETDEILKNISQKIVVDELPSTGIENYLYAIPTQNENEYDQYVWRNNLWEPLGTAQDALTDYVTQPELELELNKKKLYTEVTWQELKDLRDNSKLSPGSLYRITDYNCTTTQENTQSAGHQFDIVLLALSANKLAEEGWAMMHDNIYDVTFADGITKKCYLYCENINDNLWNVVDCETLLGTGGLVEGEGEDFIINNSNKTANAENLLISGLRVPNRIYNYFQNSNLSAWKVWYSLDNDKSRFAWADEGSVIPGELISVTFGETLSRTGTPTSTIIHKSDGDYIMLTGTGPGANFYYKQGTTVGDNGVFVGNGNPADPVMGSPFIITSINTTEPTIIPEGKGVIYRLIDEWNNDVPYDFKNILKKIPYYTLDTEYAYTFDLRNTDTGEIIDGSLCVVTASEDEGIRFVANSNYIQKLYRPTDTNISRTIDYVRLCGEVTYENENGSIASSCTVLHTISAVIDVSDVCLINCSLSNDNVFNNKGVYIYNEKVVTEPLS